MHTDYEQATARLAALGEVLPKRGSVLILTHDYPDPDAMASAAALHLLVTRHFRRPCVMAHSGIVTRAENREMMRHIRYQFHSLSSLSARRSWPTLFVDCRPTAGNTSVTDFVRPVGVIDHHPIGHRTPPGDYFADIRPDTGACASLLWEYLTAAQVPVPPWLASCMVYAIITETMDFTRPFQPADLTAYLDLLGKANMRALGLIRNAPVAPEFFAEFQQAIENARIYGNIAWSHIDHAYEPEIVAQFADRLILLERVTWSFCTAFHRDNLILSLRSDRRGVDCGGLLKRVFGSRGSAGGHERAAAGMISVANLTTEERAAAKARLVRDLLVRIDRRLAATPDAPNGQARPLVEKPTAAEGTENLTGA
jgi:nanoRNase/pAp phosphatase (c-di-AMP/oligoRNAs hydrolase)